MVAKKALVYGGAEYNRRRRKGRMCYLGARSRRFLRYVGHIHDSHARFLPPERCELEQTLYARIQEAISDFCNATGGTEATIQEACTTYLNEFTDEDVSRL